MAEEKEKRTLEGLECYQLARGVLREAYALAKRLPAIERYNLCDQMRRAATSAVLNIAEAYGRYHYLDRIRFLYYARGSLFELRGAFEACVTVGHIDDARCRQLQELTSSALRSLNGFIRHVRAQKQGRDEFGARLMHDSDVVYTIELED